MFHTIYIVKNTLNNKIYIGKTSRSLSLRWQEHRAAAKSGSDIKFHRAIRKHGYNNWQLEVLDTVDESLSSEREKYYIDKFNSIMEGYNSTLGGEGIIYHNNSFEWKCEHCSELKILRDNLKNRRKRFCSKSCATSFTNTIKWSNKVYKKELKKRISNSKKRGVYYNNLFYSSLEEAAIATNVPLSTIYWKAKNNREGWKL